MRLPQMLSGLSQIATDYDALIVDIWGVLHNGRAPFEGVDAALQKYRDGGGTVLLLSNAPRPGPSALQRLHAIGNSPDSYDDILTSGDTVRALMRDMGADGQTICHIGPDKDADLTADLDISFVDEDAANAILFPACMMMRHKRPMIMLTCWRGFWRAACRCYAPIPTAR